MPRFYFAPVEQWHLVPEKLSLDQLEDKTGQALRWTEEERGILCWSPGRVAPHTACPSFPRCTQWLRPLLAVLNSGFTKCQCITPRFAVLQGIPTLYFSLFPTNLISCYFPKHVLRYCQAWFLNFQKTDQVISTCTTWFIFRVPARFFSLSFVKFYLLFKFLFPDISSISLVLLNHFLSEFL